MVAAETAGFSVLSPEGSVRYMLEKHSVYITGNSLVDNGAERAAWFFACFLKCEEVYVFVISHENSIQELYHFLYCLNDNFALLSPCCSFFAADPCPVFLGQWFFALLIWRKNMGVIGIILLVAFVIISILLVCIILIQNEDGEGFGGLFGGTGSQAFGARSGNVLTRTTYILVTLFFLTSFGLALVNRTSSVESLDSAVQQSAEATVSSWVDAVENTEAAETTDTAVAE